jgi:hypothetical protein
VDLVLAFVLANVFVVPLLILGLVALIRTSRRHSRRGARPGALGKEVRAQAVAG